MLELNKVYCMDCLEGLKQLDSNSIDCIWIDPPYNINYKYDIYKDNKEKEEYFNFIKKCLIESERVIKKGKVIFVKQFWKNIPDMLKITDGLLTFWNLIIWKNSSPAQPNDNFKPSYEVIFMFVKGDNIDFFDSKFEVRKTLMPWDKKRKENYYGKISNIWDDVPYIYAGSIKHKEAILKEGTNEKVHPAQHPIQLVIRSIGFVTKENDVVLDFFMGSGTTAVACRQINRNFIGFEISEEYCKVIEKRLSQKKIEEF